MAPQDFKGYPGVDCAECGDGNTAIVRARYPQREFGPGEWAIYHCVYCGHHFEAIVPEPTDAQMGYLGDGVFAENH